VIDAKVFIGARRLGGRELEFGEGVREGWGLLASFVQQQTAGARLLSIHPWYWNDCSLRHSRS